MAFWENIKKTISSYIYSNEDQEITGDILQSVLNSIVNSIGEDRNFVGVAIPSTNPGSPDGPVFYLASVSGTYVNFGGLVITGEWGVIINVDGKWVFKSLGASQISDEIIDLEIPVSWIQGGYINSNNEVINDPAFEYLYNIPFAGLTAITFSDFAGGPNFNVFTDVNGSKVLQLSCHGEETTVTAEQEPDIAYASLSNAISQGTPYFKLSGRVIDVMAAAISTAIKASEVSLDDQEITLPDSSWISSSYVDENNDIVGDEDYEYVHNFPIAGLKSIYLDILADGESQVCFMDKSLSVVKTIQVSEATTLGIDSTWAYVSISNHASEKADPIVRFYGPLAGIVDLLISITAGDSGAMIDEVNISKLAASSVWAPTGFYRVIDSDGNHLGYLFNFSNNIAASAMNRSFMSVFITSLKASTTTFPQTAANRDFITYTYTEYVYAYARRIPFVSTSSSTSYWTVIYSTDPDLPSSQIADISSSIETLQEDIKDIKDNQYHALPFYEYVSGEIEITSGLTAKEGQVIYSAFHRKFLLRVSDPDEEYYEEWNATTVYSASSLYADVVDAGQLNRNTWFYNLSAGTFYYWDGVSIINITAAAFATLAQLSLKQDKLTPGTGIEILSDGTINCTCDSSLMEYVDSLPTDVSKIIIGKIYCVPNKESTEENNIFDEYYYNTAAGDWELIGRYIPKVDLTPYLKTEDAEKTYAKIEGVEILQEDVEQLQKDVDAKQDKLTDGTYVKIKDGIVDLDLSAVPTVSACLYQLGLDTDGQLVKIQTDNTYLFVGGSVDTVVTIDGQDITVPAGETVSGTVTESITSKEQTLKEAHVKGNVALTLGTAQTVASQLETLEYHYTGEGRSFSMLTGQSYTYNYTDTVLKNVSISGKATALDRMLGTSDLPMNCMPLYKGFTDPDISSLDVSQVMSAIRAFACWGGVVDFSALANWNTAAVTNMSYMFWGCSALTDLSALANWNTAAVTNMSSMFSDCSALTDLSALANWNTAAVTNMSDMFSDCSALTDLSALANWNTAAVTNMSDMFSYCSALADLSALANWNTAAVTNMSSMFWGCSALTDLSALANWNTAAVTNMSSMFYGCSALTDLSALANWNTAAVTNMSSMFYGCSKLEKIVFNDWNVAKVTSFGSMFSSCSSLTTVEGTISGIKYDLSLSNSPLTRESALVFINGLDSVTASRKLTLSSTTKALLTDDDIAIATDKGWTIA